VERGRYTFRTVLRTFRAVEKSIRGLSIATMIYEYDKDKKHQVRKMSVNIVFHTGCHVIPSFFPEHTLSTIGAHDKTYVLFNFLFFFLQLVKSFLSRTFLLVQTV
jgi:hypothetical protein